MLLTKASIIRVAIKTDFSRLLISGRTFIASRALISSNNLLVEGGIFPTPVITALFIRGIMWRIKTQEEFRESVKGTSLASHSPLSATFDALYIGDTHPEEFMKLGKAEQRNIFALENDDDKYLSENFIINDFILADFMEEAVSKDIEIEVI